MKQLAIIGPTASGKSAVALELAQKMNAYIFSIDSLSIYKKIDIVSAKPSLEELKKVKHFGINILNPDEYFNVETLLSLYTETLKKCKKEKKNLILVGGSSFYLKTLLQGLSPLPKITQEHRVCVQKKLQNLSHSYEFLHSLDKEYMQKIDTNDSYRIEKALLIYESSKKTPSQWFRENPAQALCSSMKIYNIVVKRELLRERITQRTTQMLESGLIDEVCSLEQEYGRLPHSMKSIGIVEVLEYLDAKVSLEAMVQNIITHTAQLAKRQQTFNKTQFSAIEHLEKDAIVSCVLKRDF